MNIVSTKEEVRLIVGEELMAALANISNNIEDEGKRASGRTQESLSVTVADEDGAIVGTLSGREYFGALETGSKPWRNQYKRVPKFFADIIAEWAEDKGVDINPYAVATTIMRKGSKQHRDGAITTIFTEEIDATVERIEQRVMGLFEAVVVERTKR